MNCPDPNCQASPGMEHVGGCEERARIMRDNARQERVAAERRRHKPDQSELDMLADILWWIQGALSADALACAFHGGHIEALRKARVYCGGQV